MLNIFFRMFMLMKLSVELDRSSKRGFELVLVDDVAPQCHFD